MSVHEYPIPHFLTHHTRIFLYFTQPLSLFLPICSVDLAICRSRMQNMRGNKWLSRKIFHLILVDEIKLQILYCRVEIRCIKFC